MSMKFAYNRAGGAMYNWNGMAAPSQSRAAPSSLGSLGGTTLSQPTLLLPRPGAPEPIGVSQGMGGCGCSGSCGCGPKSPMGDFIDSIPGGWIGLGVGALLVWHFMTKRRR